jgi:RNA polymerase sigma-70 factor (ECF subfamily)
MTELGHTPDERARSAPNSGLGESDLVRRAQLGSSSAFSQLVRRHGPHLYRYLVVRLRNEGDARDALQETMTAAWLGLPGLRSPDRFWPWLLTIATRKAAAAARGRVSTGEVELASLPGEDHDALELWDAVGRLSEQHREVLVLRYRFQLSEEEVAEVLGVRVGTVKSRCARARKALSELLS